MAFPSPLVSTEWLAENLSDAKVKVLDASWHLPTANRDPRAEFATGHIPGAQFFDIDGISAPGTDLPHMAASPELFAEKVGALGVSHKDTLIVYDSVGLFSAARAWWNFRAMGVTDVFVLDGGLPKWRTEVRALSITVEPPEPADFEARQVPKAIVSAAEVRQLLDNREAQIVDVRPAGRFKGEDPEPRPGLRSGHMPRALNLPFANLIANGRLVNNRTLADVIAAAGIDPSKQLVTSCGSGVTAPLLNLALAQLGVEAMRVYDGSWAEWGSRDDLPVVKG